MMKIDTEALREHAEIATRRNSGVQTSGPVLLALLAERSALLAVAQAANRMARAFPTDDDMIAAGWTTGQTSEACDAYEAYRSALAAWERDGGDQKERSDTK